MNNNEIDNRLKSLAEYLPKHFEARNPKEPMGKIAVELELLNMSMVAVFSMLGEIAKRLPEVNGKKQRYEMKKDRVYMDWDGYLIYCERWSSDFYNVFCNSAIFGDTYYTISGDYIDHWQKVHGWERIE